MVKVVKADGSREEFDREKLVRSIVAAGASEEVARSVADEVAGVVREGTSTREIRRMVLRRLWERDPEAADRMVFYDRVVKGRITYEDGKYVVVEKGNLYLGREVRDVGRPGLDTVEEVEAILRELEEDLEHGVPRRTIHNRTYVLWLAVLRSRKMSPEDKKRAVELINRFREKQGWKPLEPRKPIA